MKQVYLCWQYDNTILGIASSEKKAQEMCSELGESYMKIELNRSERQDLDATVFCKHHVKEGFLTYQECLDRGYTFSKEKVGVNND